MFVPRTARGELTSRLRLGEQKVGKISNWKIKIVERGGDKLTSLLVTKNPWSDLKCGRTSCHLCPNSDSDSRCRRRSILYENRCLTCQENGKTVLYIGESGKSAFERADEHHKDVRYKPQKSHIKSHIDEEHGGDLEQAKFGFKVLRTYKTAFQRQISEAVTIRLLTLHGKNLLNNKQELPDVSSHN